MIDPQVTVAETEVNGRKARPATAVGSRCR